MLGVYSARSLARYCCQVPTHRPSLSAAAFSPKERWQTQRTNPLAGWLAGWMAVGRSREGGRGGSEARSETDRGDSERNGLPG